jgi:hypothetical protein
MNPIPPSDHDAGIVKELLTTGTLTACYYLHRPQQRPNCQHVAVVRYGPIALCANCDQQRSTLGKATTPQRLPDPHALIAVIAARNQARQADVQLHHAVNSARHAGLAWSTIGTILGTTRQAAQQRFDKNTNHRRQPKP